jgi:FtsP/CotA-like multicopper oxidase with cupredoxin domain
MADTLDLYINDGLVPMVDDRLVYMRGYGDAPNGADATQPNVRAHPHVFLADGRVVRSRSYPLDAALPLDGRPDPLGPHPTLPGFSVVRRKHWASYFPERTLIAESGSTINLRVHNTLAGPHALRIDGIADTGPIPAGGVGTLSFVAPAAGTYVYHDPTNAPVERVLGLHGVLLVIEPGAKWSLAPGNTEFERQWLWICHDVDPVWAARARAGQTVDPVATPVLPRYFMLNDRSGFRALAATTDEHLNHTVHEDTLPSGSVRHIDVRELDSEDIPAGQGPGQLIRMVNTGVVIHQMHFHGNHVWTVRRNDLNFPRLEGRVDDEGHPVLQQWEDVVELNPLDRKAVVLPFERPPDVPQRTWDARNEDWVYPMHCHAEPSQTAAGGLYPGGLVGHWILAAPGPRRETEHALFATQVAFSSGQTREGSPATPYRQRPDISFLRKFFSRELRFPDGREHEIWSFEDERSGRRFPAPAIRVTEGQMVHVTLEASKRSHTIHHHGIEPDPFNDGAGHTSFEVNGKYTYQWQPNPGVPGDPNFGAAGSYFYHCHVNTPLHVQMGMAGPMIVDPLVHPAYPVPAGARRVFVDGPLYDVATEALIAAYTVDPRWHTLSHTAGFSGEDVGLNRFEPRYFYLLGGHLAGPRPNQDVWSPTTLRVNTADAGFPSLIRMANFSYFTSRARFTDEAGNPVAIGELVAHDGREFRDTSSPTGFSRPLRDIGRALHTSAIAFGAAERYDVLVHPPRRGVFLLHVDFMHWSRPGVLATRTIPLVAG